MVVADGTDNVEVEDAVMIAAVVLVVVEEKDRCRRSAFSRTDVRECCCGVIGNDFTQRNVDATLQVVLSVDVVEILVDLSNIVCDDRSIENRKLKVRMMPVSTCCCVIRLLAPFLVNNVFFSFGTQSHQLLMV